MVSERNRVLDLIEFIESVGIKVNIAKNKARGNKGFFKAQNGTFRIDIAKGLDDSAILATLAHEFAHFIHYNQDKSLKDLTFLSNKFSESMLEEMLELTVLSIPKGSISPIFAEIEKLEAEIKEIKLKLLERASDVEFDSLSAEIEKKISNQHYKHLLKYDSVKIATLFSIKEISIDNINADENVKLYLRLKSKQRLLKRYKSKVVRMNRYYNKPTELWARSFEFYATQRDFFSKKCPQLASLYEQIYVTDAIPYFRDFIKILL